MAADDEVEVPPTTTRVTLGEVFRAIGDVKVKIDDLARDMVGRREYDANQAGHAQAHTELARDISDVRTEAAERHAALLRTVKWVTGGVLLVIIGALAAIYPHLRWG